MLCGRGLVTLAEGLLMLLTTYHINGTGVPVGCGGRTWVVRVSRRRFLEAHGFRYHFGITSMNDTWYACHAIIVVSTTHDCYDCLSVTISASRMGTGLTTYRIKGTVTRGTCR